MDIKKKIAIVKNKMLTLMLAASGLGTASGAPSSPENEGSSPDRIEVNNFRNTNISTMEFKTSGVYKGGIEIDFAECTPHHLGWVFESGMNPGIVDRSNNYIGLFQMDLGQTVGQFLKEHKNKYPQLAALGKTKEMRKIKNGPFQKRWKELDSKEFRQDMAEFMEKHKYAPVFEELREIENLHIDVRGDALHGAICSAANQYRRDVVVKMVKRAYHEASQGVNPREVKTADIINNFYDIRAERSPELKNRLLGVTSKTGKKVTLGEKDMALDFQNFLDVQESKMTKEKLTKMLSFELPTLKKAMLNIAPSDSSKVVIKPLPPIKIPAKQTASKKVADKKQAIVDRLKRSR